MSNDEYELLILEKTLRLVESKENEFLCNAYRSSLVKLKRIGIIPSDFIGEGLIYSNMEFICKKNNIPIFKSISYCSSVWWDYQRDDFNMLFPNIKSINDREEFARDCRFIGMKAYIEDFKVINNLI